MTKEKFDGAWRSDIAGEIWNISYEPEKPMMDMMCDQDNKLHKELMIMQYSIGQHKAYWRIGNDVYTFIHLTPIFSFKSWPTTEYSLVSCI